VFERALGETRMLRWGNHLRISSTTHALEHEFTLFNASAARGHRRAARSAARRVASQPDRVPLLLITASASCASGCPRAARGGGWIRQEVRSRAVVPEAAVVLEMSFGRVRRTSQARRTTIRTLALRPPMLLAD